MSTRDVSLDAICGILIMHMIIGHIFQWASLTETDIYIKLQKIFFFFMPWFFFKSGMFYKEKELIQNIKVLYKKLIIPLIYFTILGIPHFWIILYINDDMNILHYLITPLKNLILSGNNVANMPLWFLLSLFSVTIICGTLFKYIKPIYVLLISFALATLESKLNIQVPYYISNMLVGISYYSSGFILSKIQNKESIGIICIVLYLLSILFFPQYVDVRINNLVYGNYILWFIISNASCIAYNYIFKIIQMYVPSFIVKIGRDSLVYFAMHWLVISYSALILNCIIGINRGWIMWSIILLANMVILPLSVKIIKNSKLKFIIGK